MNDTTDTQPAAAMSLAATAEGRSLAAPTGRFVYIALFGLFLLLALKAAGTRDITSGFDEVAHVSYVAHIQQTGDCAPRLEDLRLLDPRTFRFVDVASYLNHPPLYYCLMARLAPPVVGNPGALLALRLYNVLIAAIGVAALLALGRAAGHSKFEAYAYGVPIVFIPALPTIAGSVNNDNLAIAGGAVATLAAYRLLTTLEPRWLFAALGGMIAASFAKLTGLVLTGGMLASVFALMFRRGQLRLSWLALAAAAGAVACAPYLMFWIRYGGPAPVTPGLIDLFKSTTPDWRVAPRLSFPDYLGAFAVKFVEQWMPILQPRSPANIAALAIPVATIACAVAGLWASIRRLCARRDEAADVVLIAGFVAIGFALASHIVFSYGNHVAYAYLPDAYPRYYLPLAAMVPLAGLSLARSLERPALRDALMTFLVLGPIAFALTGAPLGA